MSEIERVARRQQLLDSGKRERIRRRRQKAEGDAKHSNESEREDNCLALGDVSEIGRVAMRQPLDYGV